MWPGYIPFREVTIIAGLPKRAKSTLSLSVAAIATTAGTWPGRRKPTDDPYNVLIISAEDNPDDTIVPRLKAMGADLDRFEILDHTVRKRQQVMFDLTKDLPLLERKFKENPYLAVAVIDPLVAFTGKMETYIEAQVRQMLTPLKQLAAKYNVAIICLMHFKKGQEQNVIYQIGNSVGFTGVARSVLVCADDPNDAGRKLLLSAGTNLSAGNLGFSYRIESAFVDRVKTSQVVWEEEIEGSANDVLRKSADDKLTKSDEAKAFLFGALFGGRRRQTEIEEQALAYGLSMKTVRKAAEDFVSIDRKGLGRGGVWYWSLADAQRKRASQ